MSAFSDDPQLPTPTDTDRYTLDLHNRLYELLGKLSRDVNSLQYDRDNPSSSGSSLTLSSGQDGNLTASSGTTTLAKNTYYDTVTLSGTGKIVTNGWILACKVLDLTAAGADAISWSGTAGNAATNVTGGAAPAAATAQVFGIGGNGTAGANGVVAGAGVQAAASTAVTFANGGQSNASGAGGAGSGAAGGASRAGTAVPSTWPVGFPMFPPVRILGATTSAINGGQGGPGGSSGGFSTGGGNPAGGGGGSGGNGGNTLVILADEIRVTGATAGAISSKGGAGGTGGTPIAGTNPGGGGGGSGGGGGWVYLFLRTVTGTATNIIDVSGGRGGDGGNKIGTGVVGNGAVGGDSGSVNVFNLGAGTVTYGAIVAGTANSGQTGGAGGVLQVSL